MNKQAILKELISNTSNKKNKKLLEELNNKNSNSRKFGFLPKKKHKLTECIDYIEKQNFDMSGWMLWDVPAKYVHCFINNDTKQAFDLIVLDTGEVIASYLKDGSDADAKTIAEAIEKYDTSDYWS